MAGDNSGTRKYLIAYALTDLAEVAVLLLGSVVDLLAFLTRQRASRVNGCLKTVSRQTEKINGIRRITADDFCTFQMEMDHGAFATVTLNNLVTGGQFLQEVLVVGSKGACVYVWVLLSVLLFVFFFSFVGFL